MCEELQLLKRQAVRAIRRIKQIRRARDISFFEDAELNLVKRASLHIVLKHLLVGHEGHPCPAGERPIISPVAFPRWARPAARSSPRIARVSSGIAGAVGVRQFAALAMAWALRLVRLLRSPGMESS
jgi:hypothetical protein